MARGGTGWVAALSLAGNAYQAWKNGELQAMNQALRAANVQLQGQIDALQQRVGGCERQISALRMANEQLRRKQVEVMR